MATPAQGVWGQACNLSAHESLGKERRVGKGFPCVAVGYTPIVPPKSNRLESWDYDKILYKRRNEVERLFRRLKRFRRVFTRYDKLDVMFLAFIFLALIYDALTVKHPNTHLRYISKQSFEIKVPAD